MPALFCWFLNTGCNVLFSSELQKMYLTANRAKRDELWGTFTDEGRWCDGTDVATTTTGWKRAQNLTTTSEGTFFCKLWPLKL